MNTQIHFTLESFRYSRKRVRVLWSPWNAPRRAQICSVQKVSGVCLGTERHEHLWVTREELVHIRFFSEHVLNRWSLPGSLWAAGMKNTASDLSESPGEVRAWAEPEQLAFQVVCQDRPLRNEHFDDERIWKGWCGASGRRAGGDGRSPGEKRGATSARHPLP